MNIGHAELKSWLDAGRDMALVDVLTADSFAREHIPGAANACVYQVAFLDEVAKAAPDKSRAMVVYATGPASRAAQDAAAKLTAAGYRAVRVFDGGLDAWRAAGLPLEGTGRPMPDEEVLLSLRAGGRRRMAVSLPESTLTWFGRNIATTHHGTIPFKTGELVFDNGQLSAGSLVLDMAGIASLSLAADPVLKPVLEAHLRSEDFFETAAHPQATVQFAEARSLAGATPGRPNVVAQAELTIKGVSRPLELIAAVEPRADGRMGVECRFSFDRTDFGVFYGSGRLYERLGMHLVHDAVDVHVRLVAA